MVIDYLHCISEVRIDKRLYEAAPLRGYLHCFRLVRSVQKLCEAVITSLSFHNPFEICLMKRVRYFVEALGVRCFVELLGQCLRPSTFDDICIGAERSQLRKFIRSPINRINSEIHLLMWS